LQVEALPMHPHRDVPDPGPRIQPGAESVERPVIRGHRTPGEPDRCAEKLTALVEHGLLDNLVRAQQKRLRDRQAQCLRRLEIE
jgi:hypothetical protein